MSSEAKVGIFVLLFALLVAVIAMYLGDFWVRASSYQMTAYFRDVQGLPAGAEVRFAGVRIGKVISVNLEDSPHFVGRPAAVRMAILRGNVLYDSDKFMVMQGALLGDKYVEVRRPPQRPGSRLGHSSTVAGSDSASLASLTDEARLLVKEARQTLKSVHGIVASDFNREALRMILTNVVLATRRGDALAAQALDLATLLKKSTAKSTPDMIAMVRNLRQTSESVKSTAQLVRTLLATSPVPAEVATTTTNVRKASEDLAAMSANIRAVLADPATRDKLEGLLSNMRQSSENLSRLTGRADQLLSDGQLESDLRGALTKLRESADSVAAITNQAEVLFTDPAVTGDIRATIKNAREVSETSVQAVAKAERSLDRVDRTMDRLSELTDTVRPDDMRPRVSLEANSRSGLRLDVAADLQYGKEHNDFWRIGMRDLGDAETMVLQRALPAGPGKRLRMGILGNKLGVGYDFWLDRRLAVETDLWDPNMRRLDIRGAYGISPHADLLFGVTDVGQGTDPFVGMQYRSGR